MSIQFIYGKLRINVVARCGSSLGSMATRVNTQISISFCWMASFSASISAFFCTLIDIVLISSVGLGLKIYRGIRTEAVLLLLQARGRKKEKRSRPYAGHYASFQQKRKRIYRTHLRNLLCNSLSHPTTEGRKSENQ